jgi:hypothetical protein
VRGVEAVHGGPAVDSVADVGGDACAAGKPGDRASQPKQGSPPLRSRPGAGPANPASQAGLPQLIRESLDELKAVTAGK